jgi:hypothetical protein
MNKFIIISLFAAVAMVAVFGVFTETVKAQSDYLTVFTNTVYQSTKGTVLDDCILCHNSGETTLNPYGLDILNTMTVNSVDVEIAIYLTDWNDSDSDSVNNYYEIITLNFPGDPTDYPVCEDNDGDGVFNFYFCTPSVPDCNDNDPAMFPGNTEICDDAKDNDCDGKIDVADSDCESWICAESDLDGDGFSTYGEWCGPVDCNDSDITIFPGACDIRRDGIDQNCDGVDRRNGPPCK